MPELPSLQKLQAELQAIASPKPASVEPSSAIVSAARTFINDTVAVLVERFGPALIPLVASHAFSFVTNFLGKKEYRNRTLEAQFEAGFNRVAPMFLGAWVMAVLVTTVHLPLVGFAVTVTAKTIIDLVSHARSHWTTASDDASV